MCVSSEDYAKSFHLFVKNRKTSARAGYDKDNEHFRE